MTSPSQLIDLLSRDIERLIPNLNAKLWEGNRIVTIKGPKIYIGSTESFPERYAEAVETIVANLKDRKAINVTSIKLEWGPFEEEQNIVRHSVVFVAQPEPKPEPAGPFAALSSTVKVCGKAQPLSR